MKPYYDDGNAVIYHGNALDLLPLPCDLLLTDPPYGIGAAEWDQPVPWEPLAPACVPAGGFVVAFGLLATLAPVSAALEAAGLEREAEMVWVRGVLGTGGDRFGRSHELWTVHHKPPRRPPRVDRVRVPYAPASKPSPSHRRHELGAAPGSVWYVHETSGSYAAHEHETAKPVPLIARIVLALSDEGDTVLDPFMGSGSTLVAARATGRKAVGVEREERFCEIAARRLAQGAFDFGEAS